MSMWKTRPSRCIQRMGAGRDAGDSRTDWGPGLGMMRWRCLQFGANTPWYRVRWPRGRGTERARAASGTSRGGETGDAKSAGLPICTAGGCPEGVRHTDVPHEVDGVEHDMSRPVTESVLVSIHDLPAVIDRETFVRQRGAGDVAAQAFDGVPFMGFAHGAGMEGGPRELGDAGVVGRRAGVDGAKRQVHRWPCRMASTPRGLAPRGVDQPDAPGRSQGLRSLAEAADVPAGGLPGGRTTG